MASREFASAPRRTPAATMTSSRRPGGILITQNTTQKVGGTDPESKVKGDDRSLPERTFGEEFSMKAGWFSNKNR